MHLMPKAQCGNLGHLLANDFLGVHEDALLVGAVGPKVAPDFGRVLLGALGGLSTLGRPLLPLRLRRLHGLHLDSLAPGVLPDDDPVLDRGLVARDRRLLLLLLFRRATAELGRLGRLFGDELVELAGQLGLYELDEFLDCLGLFLVSSLRAAIRVRTLLAVCPDCCSSRSGR